MKRKTTILTAVALFGLAPLAACDDPNDPVDDAVDTTEDAIDDTGDAIEDGVDDVDDGLEGGA